MSLVSAADTDFFVWRVACAQCQALVWYRRPIPLLGLRSHIPNSINSINSNMTEHQANLLQPIPQVLDHLVYLNVEFGVLVCLGNRCRKAVSPSAISEHLRKRHQTTPEIRKRVREYIKEFLYTYDHSTVRLPKDGSALQPVIPIIDGFQYKHCAFRSQNRKIMKVHRNKEHLIKRVENKELYNVVRLQTWF
jgi:hypothetical protein